VIWRFFFLREVKKFPLFFLMLFLTLSLGILGLTGISIVSEQVKVKLQENARGLLTSDLVVSSRRDLFETEKSSVNEILAKFSFKHYRVIDVYSMVTHLNSGQLRLVEIRAIEEGFPFYGKIEPRQGEFGPEDLFISQDLAELWNVQEGEDFKIGTLTVKVAGIIAQDSSQGLRGFSLAPRLYLPLKQLEQSGLLQPGATGSFAYHYYFPELSGEKIQSIKDQILQSIKDVGVRVTLPQESSEQTGRILNYLTDFMALAALIGLILSLVGVFYLYQSHLLARLKDLALLNLHGLSKKNIILATWGQFSFLFLIVFLFQLLFIIPGYKLLSPYLTNALGLELSREVNLSGVLLLLPFLYGLGVAIVFPLLLGLLRTSMGAQLKSSKLSMGSFRFYDFLPFLILLWTFACFLSQSLLTGSLFFVALMVVFLLSNLLVILLQFSIKKLTQGKGLLLPTIEAGVALKNLSRSGHKLTLSFLSLAMGATLISLILQLDRMIQSEFTLDDQKPGLFIFDIQEDQLEPLLDFSRRLSTPLEGVTPMVRARIEKLNGKEFTRDAKDGNLRTREDEVESRFRNRGVNLTYRRDLSASEKIVEGEAFPEATDLERPAFLSLEKRFATRLGIKLGDRLTFDVQGIEVDGVVRNFREVKWTSFYPNFFINVEPGYIDEAPKTFLAVWPAGPRSEKTNFQRKSIELFPNISFIDVEEIISKLSTLFEKSRQAIEIISLLSLGVGFIILYGLSHDQVYRRYYDLALMKTLGFSAGSLRRHLLWEFGLLFFLAMGLGFFLGWAMALLIGREVFKLTWSLDWERVFYPGLGLTILCLMTIILSSWRAIRAKPRELLSDS
jgi:putative ABC transport system permease protein